MSRKLLAGAVAAASMLALTPTVASAEGQTGSYRCYHPFLGRYPVVYTTSDATEDGYESWVYVTSAGVPVHYWICSGD